MDRPQTSTVVHWAGVILALGLFAVFAWTAIAVVRTVTEPPRLADVAPTAVPQLLSSGIQPGTPEPDPSGTATDSPTAPGEPAATEPAATDAAPADAAGAPAAEPGALVPTPAPVTSSPTSTDATATPATAQLAPQHRGAFDPNARLLALLAVISPLVTTIVGFFFGQQAGNANAREADTARTAAVDDARTTIERTSGTDEAEAFLRRVREKGYVRR